MRRALIAAAFFMVAAILTGMGNLGGAPEGQIPKPQVNVKAQIVDRSGVSTELSRFAMDGRVSFIGSRGAGDMSILFRDIRQAGFGKASGDEVPVDLMLKDGRRVQLKVPKSAVFSGETGYGGYWIKAENVERIVVEGEVAR